MTNEEYINLVSQDHIKELVIEFLKRKKLFTPEPKADVAKLAIKIKAIFDKGVYRKAGGAAARLIPKLRWFFEVTKYTEEEVLEMCEKYIRLQNQKRAFPMDAHNFIVNQDGKPTKLLEQSELYSMLNNNVEEKPSSFTNQL
ncbi:MAG TPA: hypothetical protein PKD00_00695 [Burkholderiales bacterium]|nr:hypothetical protein [Burkholderiales bacterium]